MSRYIGRRVFYSCYNCGTHFTLNNKTVEVDDGVLCKNCSKEYKKVKNIIGQDLKEASDE